MFEMAKEAGLFVLFLGCVVMAGYMIFLPLVATIMGAVKILKTYALGRSVEVDPGIRLGSVISDPELGLTMADGGERAEKAQGARPADRNKKQL